MALSTKLNHLPPLTPLPSADTMRSVQIEASAHHQVRGCPPATSPPCIALAQLAAITITLTFPTHSASCLPSLKAVLLPALFAARVNVVFAGQCQTGSSPERQVSPLTPS